MSEPPIDDSAYAVMRLLADESERLSEIERRWTFHHEEQRRWARWWMDRDHTTRVDEIGGVDLSPPPWGFSRCGNPRCLICCDGGPWVEGFVDVETDDDDLVRARSHFHPYNARARNMDEIAGILRAHAVKFRDNRLPF